MPLIPDKFSLQINMGTVILSLIMTIGGGMTDKFGYKGADEAVVQVAIMILVGMYSIYAAKTSEYNSDRKLEQMTTGTGKDRKFIAKCIFHVRTGREQQCFEPDHRPYAGSAQSGKAGSLIRKELIRKDVTN